MDDNFTQKLWKLGLDNPELRDTIIAQLDKEHRGYLIPVREPLAGSDELETIEVRAEAIEDPVIKRRTINALKECKDLTVGELAQLAYLDRVALLTEEVKGRKLEREEETLKDVDIMALALMILVDCVSHYSNAPEEPKELEEK